jgi:hypothetical protein
MKLFSFKGIFIAVTALLSLTADAQDFQLYLKSGTVTPSNDPKSFSLAPDPGDVFKGSYYRIIQFSAVPTSEEQKAIEQSGIKLLYYVPRNAYFASIPNKYDLNQLSKYNVRSITEVKPEWKLNEELSTGKIPGHAFGLQGEVDVVINYYPDKKPEDIKQALEQKGIKYISSYDSTNSMKVRIKQDQLQELSELPFISYIEPIDPPSLPENLPGRTDHRSNYMATEFTTGRHYNGSGVKIAMGDDGIIGPHADYQGRVNQTNVRYSDGNHGDHVAGTIMGAGNIDPKARGMAYGAELYVYDVWDAVTMTPNTYYKLGIRLTSTSYANGCNAGYTSMSQMADQQLRQMPSLMHVFSAGNSGEESCGYGGGYGWGTITGGIKAGKNVICVGNIDYIDNLAESSSRGPTQDGRIKPDVCAMGDNVYSTVDDHTYELMSGTSMACPGVTGTLAQLYHAYRSLNGNADPDGGLIKAVVMNSADDLGNPGPDFKFGFGRINAARAVRTLEDKRYFTSSINQGISNTHTITVPEGTKQLRVLLYWTDYEAVTNATIALVNDINMQVTNPSSAVYKPWVLDHSPSASKLNALAVRGADDLNNAEQVTIDNPEAGKYTVKINGFAIPKGPQTYYVVYELINDDITLIYPIGSEGFVPGEKETIRWDAYGNTGIFKLDYSTNNGETWIPITSSVSGALRYYDWTVPFSAGITGKALVKVTRGSSSDVSDASFSIIPVPTGLKVSWACRDSVGLTWDAMPGVSRYEISKLGSKYMDSVGVSATNKFTVKNINSDNELWFSVRALGANDAKGRRAVAVNKPAHLTFQCPYQYDPQLLGITSPTKGIRFACHDNSKVPVTLKIKNTGTRSLSNINVHYRIGTAAEVSEIFPGPLAPGDSAEYTFKTTANLSAATSHYISAYVQHLNDGDQKNNNANTRVEITSSPTITLPWKEDLESFTVCSSLSNCGTAVCTLPHGLVNEKNGSGDDIDWRTFSGPTPSTSTGPDYDHTRGKADMYTGKYLYLEASICDNKTANLITPCIDLTDVSDAKFSFWYHMHGINIGSLHVDINSKGNWINDAVPALKGYKGDEWKEQIMDLSAYAGQTINIRLRGETSIGSAGDIAIDDLSLSSSAGVEGSSEFFTYFQLKKDEAKETYQLMMNGKSMGELKLEVKDEKGKTVLEKTSAATDEKITLDLSNTLPGAYLLQVTSGSKTYQTKITKL